MNFNTMLTNYLNERYGDNLEINWDEYLARYELECLSDNHGFVTYKLQGDAAIIADMWVETKARGHTHSWKLHDQVINAAKERGKRVAITFSDFKGINHMAGIAAMKRAGFVPAFKTAKEFVFMKGI